MSAARTMRITTIVTSALTALLFLGHAESDRAQTPPTTQPDIYANFVGVWVGVDHHSKDGKDATELLRLTITETKKKDGMKWDYLYNTGEKKEDRYTKHMIFHPAKAEIVMQWDEGDKEHFKAVDLDVLAKNGYRVFYATNTYQQDGKRVTYLVKFDLEADTFRYGWFYSEDGKNFIQDSSFLLKREANSSSSH